MHSAMRGLDPTSVRASRVLMHLSLLAGVAAAGGQADQLRTLFNPAYGAPPADLPLFFKDVSARRA